MTQTQFDSADAVADDIWTSLAAAVRDRQHPWRSPVIASVEASGMPSARMVVLRGARRADARLTFHTDSRSPKYGHLSQIGKVAWVFYDPHRAIQLRVISDVSLHCADDEARETWSALALGSRKTYCYRAAPGSPSDSPLPALSPEWHAGRPPLSETDWAFEHFVVAHCTVISWDWLHLRAAGHQRLACSYSGANPAMQWLIP